MAESTSAERGADAAVGAMRAAVEELGVALDGASTPVQMLELMLESLDRYSGEDPTSLLFAETFLAATRDEQLRASLGQIVEEFRQLLARWLVQVGVQAPEQTAVVLAAAVDGLVLHRALSPGLTASSVAPVLRRLLPTSPQKGAKRTVPGRS
jgi:AcrR family transcriptional regulator